MKLLTAAIRKAMPKDGSNSNLEMEQTPIICKFFLPEGRGTWYITEGSLYLPDGTEKALKECAEAEIESEANEVIFYGYCLSPLGQDCDEFGRVSYKDLKSVRTSLLRLPMERDMSFPIGKRMLSEVFGKSVSI